MAIRKASRASKKTKTVKKKTAKKRSQDPKRVTPKKTAKVQAKKTVIKKAVRKTSSTSSSASIAALSKKVSTVSTDTKSLSQNLKVIVKIFGDNQKILVSMKVMINDLVGALDLIQKQSKRIGSLETDTQNMFDGMGEMRTHTRMIAKLDSQTAKLQETIHGILERTRTSGGIDDISKKVNENHDSIKNNAQMIIKIGRHVDKIYDNLGSSVRESSIKEVHSDIAQLKTLFEEAQAKYKDNSAINAEISTLSQKMVDLSQIPTTIGSVQKRLQELFSINDTLAPAVDELRRQIGKVITKADSMGSLESIRDEFTSLRNEVQKRASKLDDGFASITESLGRSEKSVAEFHKKADTLFESMRGLKGTEARKTGESTSEVMALLRLSDFQSNVRMTTESKYGEIADIENIAKQTVDIINIFDKLTVETGSNLHLPQGVKQWAISKIFECSDRWEIRFSDVLQVLQENIGILLLKESVRTSQVRDIYGTRAVDELKSIFDNM